MHLHKQIYSEVFSGLAWQAFKKEIVSVKKG